MERNGYACEISIVHLRLVLSLLHLDLLLFLALGHDIGDRVARSTLTLENWGPRDTPFSMVVVRCRGCRGAHFRLDFLPAAQIGVRLMKKHTRNARPMLSLHEHQILLSIALPTEGALFMNQLDSEPATDVTRPTPVESRRVQNLVAFCAVKVDVPATSRVGTFYNLAYPRIACCKATNTTHDGVGASEGGVAGWS